MSSSRVRTKNWFLLLLMLLFFSTKGLVQSDLEKKFNSMVSNYDAQDYQGAVEHGSTYLLESPDKDTTYARVLNYVAYSYFFLEDYVNACSYMEQERNLRLAIQGKDHDDTEAATYSLGLFYTYIGDFASSAPLMKRSLHWFSQYYDKSSEEYINLQASVASVYEQAGSYKRAEELYDQVYEALKENYDIHDNIYQKLLKLFLGGSNRSGH